MVLAQAVALAASAALLGAQTAKPTTSFTGDLGYVGASGNTKLTTLSIGDKLVHTDGPWTLTQIAAYVYGETNNTESANQLAVSGRADWAFQPRLGLFGGVSYERNPFAGFSRRIGEMAGLRWKAVVAPRDSLSVDAGGVITQQTDVSGTTDDYPSARLAGNYKHVFSKLAYFQQLAEYLPDLQSNGGYRVNTESSLVAPISTHIGIKIAYAINYNSQPPVNFGTTDRVVTAGVQISY
ncbi:MAG: DUF481 domain-containing protein [Gemmatimonadaceae bacterium]